MTDLRYPIGPPEIPPSLTPEDRRTLTAQLAAQPEMLRDSIAGLSEEQLDTPYRPDGWTVRQVVHHLADANLNWYVRTKLALTEEQPTIKPFAESPWADLPDARSAPVETSLALMDGMHKRWAQFLGSLTAADWARQFNHPERGLLNLDHTLAVLVWHGRHHTAHITELRKRMKWD